MGRNALQLALILAIFAACRVHADDAPVFEDVHVVSLPIGEYGYRGMPGTIAVLDDGRLLLAYTHYTPEGQADGAIAAKHSSDAGKTWGDEFTLVPAPASEGTGRYCHPSFLRLNNGQVLLAYIYASPAPHPNLYGHTYFRRSLDNGKTWGDQLIMTPGPGYQIMHNDKLIQLSTGRLLAPVETESADAGDDHRGYTSLTYWSDDNGYSWHCSKNAVNALPIEAQEPHVVELKDGRVMMLMRTYSAFVLRSYSADKGETWSAGEPIRELPLPPNSSALNVKRIPSTGDLLLIRSTSGPPSNPSRRSPMTAVLSKDDGATWTNERTIAGDLENDYGYPGLTFLDNLALVTFHARDGLHVARIDIEWFYGE
ncbi:MAG: exo-alpha-sialidase [Candidatus Hydrogenedentes bacterium]|nr:exo-alpha-sialidase [Candidatus Hydrogenedentota bacterium]